MHADWAIERIADSRMPTDWTHRRECRSVCRALSDVPSGSAVLDISCGSGRWLESLGRRGDRITCANPSEGALADAADHWQEIVPAGKESPPTPEFVLASLPQTSFPDRHFDAVICTGYFDRLSRSDLRIEALLELRRISRGPIVVSFCNAFSLDALQLGLARSRSSTGSRQRIPVPVWSFLNDLRRAGLNPLHRHAVLWGISSLWHIVSLPVSGRAVGSFGKSSASLTEAA
jgi:SAM-dependent methyltransferase